MIRWILIAILTATSLYGWLRPAKTVSELPRIIYLEASYVSNDTMFRRMYSGFLKDNGAYEMNEDPCKQFTVRVW